MENWSNGLEALRTSVFGGYKKEDVLEYIDFLLSEMEILKKEYEYQGKILTYVFSYLNRQFLSIDRKQLFMFDNYPRQMVEFQYKQIPYTSVLKNLLQEKF